MQFINGVNYIMNGTNTQYSIEKSLDYIYQYTGKHFKFEKLNKRLYEKC